VRGGRRGARSRVPGNDHTGGVIDELIARMEAMLEPLQAPGQVLLKLAATGFGVRLPA
jgi:hypothetical protein